jgi:hypothetical protein
LQAGVLTEQQLMERSRRALEDRDRGSSSAGDLNSLSGGKARVCSDINLKVTLESFSVA